MPFAFLGQGWANLLVLGLRGLSNSTATLTDPAVAKAQRESNPSPQAG